MVTEAYKQHDVSALSAAILLCVCVCVGKERESNR